MTLEELGAASAERNSARMQEDLHRTRRPASNPRIEPVSSRYSLASAGESAASPPTEPVEGDPPRSTPPATAPCDAEVVQRVLTSLASLEHRFYDYTTPAQRAYVRSATCSPSFGGLRNVYSNPHMALVVTAVVAFLLGAFAAQGEKNVAFRGISANCAHAIDRMVRFA